MNRRTYLTAVAALTAGSGCLGAATSLRTTVRTRKSVSVSDVARRPPADPEKVDEEENPHGLRFDVTVDRAAITGAETARVSLVYTNGGEDTLKVNVNPDQPGYVASLTSNPGLVLLSETYTPTRSSGDCWKPEREQFGELAVAYQYPIEPGESATLEYDMWAAPAQQAACIQPGDYEFEPLYGAFTLSVERQEPERPN